MEEVSSPEQRWRSFKSAVLSAQQNLPELPATKEKKRVTDELRELSQLKKQRWLKWKASPHDAVLHDE